MNAVAGIRYAEILTAAAEDVAHALISFEDGTRRPVWQTRRPPCGGGQVSMKKANGRRVSPSAVQAGGARY